MVRMIAGVARAIDKVDSRAVFSEYGGATVNIGKKLTVPWQNSLRQFRGKLTLFRGQTQ